MTQDPKNSKKPVSKADSTSDEDGEARNGKGPQAPPPVKFSRGLLSWLVIIGMLGMLFVVLNSSKRGDEIDFSQLKIYLKNDSIKDNAVLVLDDRINAE